MGDLNKIDIKSFKDKFNLQIFIETGTGTGSGLKFALKFAFYNLFSTEIYQPCFEKLIKEFDGFRNIHLYNKSSTDFLNEILPQFSFTNQNILFWLDAHFPGSDADGVDRSLEKDLNIKFPLQQELNIIYKHRKDKKDVIVVDDFMFYDQNKFTLWKEFFNKNVPKLELDLSNFKSFEIRKYYTDTGYLVFVPKQ